MTNIHVLIAEDDPASATLLKKYLEAKKYTVTHARDGREVLTLTVQYEPDVVLLDVEMPERNGWEALAEIRAITDVPVIMVTVKSDTSDKIRGLEAGADDYVTKPFDLKEIEARIRAVLRRRRVDDDNSETAKIITVGTLSIDDRSKKVLLGQYSIRLSPKEYELLMLLCSHPGQVFESEEIIASVWPERFDATSEDVKKYIYFLRNKLNEASERANEVAPMIKTVRGFGYKIEKQSSHPT